MLEKMPKIAETKLVGITDYGYCEVSETIATHFHFFLPACTSLKATPSDAPIVERGFAYTLKGTDWWIPENVFFVDISRTTTSFEEGWEHRTEKTNGLTTEHWWVPTNKQEAFELFIKDNASK